MRIFKRIIAVMMVMAMTLSLAACSDTSWVYDYSGKKVSSGLYIAFTMDAYTQAGQQEGLDTNIKDIFKQTIGGKSAKDWMIDKAKTASNFYMAVENKFDELGLSFSEKEINEINQSIKTAWAQYEPIYTLNGVSDKSYRLLVENSKKQQLIFNKYYGTDGIEAVSDDNLLVHFKENFVSINMFGIPLVQPLDGVLADEDKKTNEQAKADAEKYAKMYNDDKKSVNEIYDAYVHEANETEHKSDDPEDVIGKDDETQKIVHRTASSYSEKVIKALFDELKPDGKAHVIADDKAYYVVVKYDVTADKTRYEEMKPTVLADIKGEDFQKMMEGFASALTPTANNAAVSRYNPKNIKTK